MPYSRLQRWSYLLVLFLVSTSNYFDRYVMSVLLEPIKREFRVSDTALGLIGGFAFAAFFAVLGLPIARWADSGNRRTIIALALAVWSAMTLACGFTLTFWQLAVARVGVGAGEAGAVAPAQSLIADYFPAEQRAMALAIFTSASTVGYLLGFGAGGYIAALYGWRSAFLLAGLPGLLLVLIVRLTLPEPRLQLRASLAQSTQGKTESARQALVGLWRKRSFRHALVGCISFLFLPYGAFVFIPSFLIRLLHVSLIQASATYGSVTAVASLLGTLAGGHIADRLGRQDVRWFAWLPAGACLLAAPVFMLAFAADDFRVFVALAFVANVLILGGVPVVWAAIHVICGNQRRATAVAIVLFSTTLISGGCGPLATGALSDALTPMLGAEALRYTLIAATGLLIASAVSFHRFGRTIQSDVEA